MGALAVSFCKRVFSSLKRSLFFSQLLYPLPTYIEMADLSRSVPSKGGSLSPHTQSQREVKLQNWCPVLGENKLILSGTLQGYDKEWGTSRVLSRKSEREIVTKSKIYILDGPMKLPEDKELRSKIPLFIQHKFHDGFPENWELLVQHWRRFIRTQLAIKETWKTFESNLENCNTTNDNSLSPVSQYVRSVPPTMPLQPNKGMSLCNQSQDVSCFFVGKHPRSPKILISVVASV
ncbi:uncharacterized protein LOC111716184 isoform X1 [Eurytemora carolleeae]|uniref:uncharacterized protein LOC111716184 isoform X1 n=1 Tax=Eurytemora carolleeae TaxID=1294199 RepID=UPI000C78258A|nr:uncharacterized protein LOC111716184 isoform X1 [Eurytemora carolleeae]|eukprot:XP_023347384.1 uncharacterized protein LOC111716184 isoform X1 [Eurytemora affinis]